MAKGRTTTGIRKRHARSCKVRTGGRCNCNPAWQAGAWDSIERKRIWRTFPTEAAAKGWRRDAEKAIEDGRLTAGQVPRLREAANAWLAGAKAGTILTRSGDPFKPSTIRSYEHALRKLLPRVRQRAA